MPKSRWKNLALVAIISSGVLATSAGIASAMVMPMTALPATSSADTSQEVAYRHHDRYYGHHPFYRHRHYGHRRPGFTFYFGGWWYAQPWWEIRPRLGGGARTEWCLNRYRSYNPMTNRYLGFDGRHHACRSPYRG